MVLADTALIVFTRKPVPGEVKTRLIGALGAEGAAALQCRLLLLALETGRDAGFDAIELYCTPDCDHPFLRDCNRRFSASLYEQRGNGLGERMAGALDGALSRHANAILIGCDVPSLTVDDLRSARSVVESGRIVIGPAEDGGYVLIGVSRRHGLKGPLGRYFTGMSWGGPDIMDATRRLLISLGEEWVELPARWDVDTPADLERLGGSIAGDFSP